MLGLIGAAIGAVSAIFQYLNTEAARKYIDQLVKLKTDLQAEEDKGYQSDDAKIEDLHKQIKVIFDAAQQEIALHLASKS